MFKDVVKLLECGLFTFILCCMLSSCVSAAMTGANAIYNRYSWQNTFSDYAIILRAQKAIDKDPEFSSDRINITSFNQILLLTGQTHSEYARQRAGAVVSKVPHVLRIYNCLTVTPHITDNTIVQDTWITTKIKTRLIATNGLDPRKIKVVTENKIVYLMGILPRDQADIAVDIAKETEGVDRVVKIFFYIIMPKI